MTASKHDLQRNAVSALFVAGLILSSAVGCNFTKTEKVKQASTDLASPEATSLSASVFYSDQEIKGRAPSDRMSQRALRTAKPEGKIASYLLNETITLSENRFMYLELDAPIELDDLENLTVSSEIEWEGQRHALNSGITTVKSDETAGVNIRLSVESISEAIEFASAKSAKIYFRISEKNKNEVAILLPVRMPPVSIGFALKNLSEFESEDPQGARDAASQTILGVQITLAQVATVTNNEDQPIKLQVARSVSGLVSQLVQHRYGPSLGPKRDCKNLEFGRKHVVHSFGGSFIILPLGSRLGTEAEKSLRDRDPKMVLLLKPKETVKFGLFVLFNDFEKWRLDGPVRENTGGQILWCSETMGCAPGEKEYFPVRLSCIKNNKGYPIETVTTVGTVGPTILDIHGIDSSDVNLSLGDRIGAASLIKASFFSDFKLTKTPPSYRVRVFKDKSELPWREGL